MHTCRIEPDPVAPQRPRALEAVTGQPVSDTQQRMVDSSWPECDAKHEPVMSGFNWKYKEAMPRVMPEWTGEKLTRLKKAYFQLQVRKGRAEGEQATRLRVPLPRE